MFHSSISRTELRYISFLKEGRVVENPRIELGRKFTVVNENEVEKKPNVSRFNNIFSCFSCRKSAIFSWGIQISGCNASLSNLFQVRRRVTRLNRLWFIILINRTFYLSLYDFIFILVSNSNVSISGSTWIIAIHFLIIIITINWNFSNYSAMSQWRWNWKFSAYVKENIRLALGNRLSACWAYATIIEMKPLAIVNGKGSIMSGTRTKNNARLLFFFFHIIFKFICI